MKKTQPVLEASAVSDVPCMWMKKRKELSRTPKGKGG